MVVTILSAVSLILAVLITVTIFKKNAKREKLLDAGLTVLKAGVDSMIPKIADGKVTAEEAGQLVTDLINKAKEVAST